MMLSAFIALEMKNPDSKYKEFLETWPSSSDEFPVMYSQDQLDLLKGTTLEAFTQQRISQFKSEYNIITSELPDLKITERDYFSLVNLIYSRVFQQGSQIALVPIADMCNCQQPCNTKWGFNEHGFFLKSIEDIPRG